MNRSFDRETVSIVSELDVPLILEIALSISVALAPDSQP
jgi:hypothetical protein